ncbi:hypothetical protein [Psychrobacillus sp. FJAT-21963]|uniref:hypothetical protein n=1 Tax=Psychrobacillus sp. FJAT-21963 TaxID=1712028 RepID=UPI0006F75FEC|nr:hypothetical protein [Psychrobacillus sp. FJAT-21963]KQL33634.1 hypothetical protein AN959_15990 [Psychrobacillus sp. FJAT-21963]
MISKLKKLVSYFIFKIGLKSKQSSVGWTTFAPIRIVPEYTNIDLEKKQVTGVVNYNGKAYLTVIVDVQNNKTKIKGSLRRIDELTKPFKKGNYIEIIKSEAKFLIENGITNPKEYYSNR